MEGEARIQGELTQVFEAQYKKLFGVGIPEMTENVQDTEEVLQNIFIKAYSNLGKFRGDSKLSTWLYRIAVNESYDYMKS